MHQHADRCEDEHPPTRAAPRRIIARAPAKRAVPAPIGPEGGPLDHGLATRIQASRGDPLEAAIRTRMERSFGADFGAVRIHRSDIAPALSARAFTLGTDVHFAPGEYRPATADGQELLAHELSHVVQQGDGVRRSDGRLQRAVYVGAADDAAERSADRMAHAALGRARPTEIRHPLARDVVESVVLRRRIDVTALGKAIRATTTSQQATGEVTARLRAPKEAVVQSLVNDERRETFVEKLDGELRTVDDEVQKAPFTAANVARVATKAGAAVNEVEDQVTVRTQGLEDINDVATAKRVHDDLAKRYKQAREALRSVGTPEQVVALDRAERDALKQLRERDFHAKTRSKLADLAVQLDTAEQATDPVQLMKVGTEFSFTSDTINQLDISSNKGAHFKEAVRLINQWAAAVPSQRIVWDRSNNSVLAPPAETKRPLNWADKRSLPADSSTQKCIRFTYTLPSRNTWWWQLNVDYQCIETQTDPATRKLLTSDWQSPDGRAVAGIISNHIFGIARTPAINVAPHATIGGGHITLDRATTFGTNALSLRNFLVLYSNDSERWAGEDQDKFNAPMIREMRPPGPAKFKAVIARFDSGDIKDADTLVKALTDEVFVHKHLPLPQNDDEVAADKSRQLQPAHYQAINLEKWGSTDTEGARLEMRRFDAQEGLDDLLSSIDAIIDLLNASRVPEKVPFTW